MKKSLLKAASVIVVLLLTVSCVSYAAVFEISDCRVKSIDVSDDYAVCTRSYADERINGNDYEMYMNNDATLQLMGFMPDSGAQVLLYVEKYKAETQESNSGNALEKQLAGDYNVTDNKDEIVDKEKTALTNASCIVESAEIYEFENGLTPYVMSKYSSGGMYITQFKTVYGGDTIILQFRDSAAADDGKTQAYKKTVESIVYDDTFDYTKTRDYLLEKKSKEAEKAEDTVAVEESSNIIFGIVAAVVVGVLAFAVYMATRKRRSSKLKNSQE